MAALGVKDFAGGIVVHATSGFSALASLAVLGRRTDPNDPHKCKVEEPDDTGAR